VNFGTKRVGHPSDKILKYMFKIFKEYYNKCEVYRIVKHTRLLFYNFNSKSSEIFKLVHFKLWGPTPVDSYDNFKYYIIFIDDFFKKYMNIFSDFLK
jgi:hypothetical protein